MDGAEEANTFAYVGVANPNGNWKDLDGWASVLGIHSVSLLDTCTFPRAARRGLI